MNFSVTLHRSRATDRSEGARDHRSGESLFFRRRLAGGFWRGERHGRGTRAHSAAYYRCFLSIRELQIPTVAAVNGPAVGAGLNLALACDMRLASPAARFGATFTRIGLHPGGGCTAFLVAAFGRQRATHVLLTGANLSAEEALGYGLVLQMSEDPLADALALAEELGALEPWLVSAVLRSVDVAATSPFEVALEVESWAQAESTHSPRFREWIAEFA